MRRKCLIKEQLSGVIDLVKRTKPKQLNQSKSDNIIQNLANIAQVLDHRDQTGYKKSTAALVRELRVKINHQYFSFPYSYFFSTLKFIHLLNQLNNLFYFF